MAVDVREPALERGRKVVIGGVHVGEHRVAERLAVPTRNLDAVEHVGEADERIIGHVGMPILPGIGYADLLSILDNVGEEHDFRHIGLAVSGGLRSLQGTESLRERVQGTRVERLLWKPNHTVFA